MKMNQLQENPNGCLEQTESEDEGISSILEELGTYICDKVCLSDYTTMTQEEQEQCCAVCRLKIYIDRISQEYDKINSFDYSQAMRIMNKYKNIVLCEECEYKIHLKTDDRDYCLRTDGMYRVIKAGDGCSIGRKR